MITVPVDVSRTIWWLAPSSAHRGAISRFMLVTEDLAPAAPRLNTRLPRRRVGASPSV